MVTIKTSWVKLLYPGMFFGDTGKVKLPADKCRDDETLAVYLKTYNKDAVAFRRFVYTKDGPEYLDRGWVFFRGVPKETKVQRTKIIFITIRSGEPELL